MSKVSLLLHVVLLATLAAGSYHTVIITQKVNDKETIVPSIVTVAEGSDLSLNCKSVSFGSSIRPGNHQHEVIWSRVENRRHHASPFGRYRRTHV
ncbi:uncharacterized protein LOC116181171 isoform X2 [Photinus pyralis]|uniref:uncharacterized protein LOC116181171 isoform X2 n=1 Tax=Photinus pyralis TaxID=7054 RepID=UPI0012676C61|nr:uncharacterized protein LOC116181171 isoform X2 [Photinus pyralis]